MGSPVRLKKVTKSPHFFHQAKCFCGDAEISHLYSIKSGENALVSLYNGKDQNILDNLHYQRFTEKVLKSLKVVEPQSLPPTPRLQNYTA